MTNRLNYILFGIVNQPQIWIKQRGVEITNIVNYLILGIINQPQLWVEYEGKKMDTEIKPKEKDEDEKVNIRVQGGSSGAVYGLGLIGACIYYISRAATPQQKAMGFLKALVWPVFLVKGMLEFLEKQ